jgi:hypothetical protein
VSRCNLFRYIKGVISTQPIFVNQSVNLDMMANVDEYTDEIKRFCAQNHVEIYMEDDVYDKITLHKAFRELEYANGFVAIRLNGRRQFPDKRTLQEIDEYNTVRLEVDAYQYGFDFTRGGGMQFNGSPISTWDVTIQGRGFFVIGPHRDRRQKENDVLIEELVREELLSIYHRNRDLIHTPAIPAPPRMYGPGWVSDYKPHAKTKEETNREFFEHMQWLSIDREPEWVSMIPGSTNTSGFDIITCE